MHRMTVPRLSTRETEVLFWIGEGKSDWEIGAILALAPKTVNAYAESAKRKLGAANRMLLVRMALRRGLLQV
jgi:LuxR family transcriptional regulator, quorum-sensing system regulator BjaR1